MNNNKLKEIKRNGSQKVIATAVSIGLVSTLGTVGLVGCASQPTEETFAESKQSPELANKHPEELGSKIFEPYQHVYFKRYDLLTERRYAEKILGGQIEIPEGYTILEIENFNQVISHGSQTRGFDVWFTNASTVEVQPVYNESLGIYDYSEPGKVIQLEEESAKVLEKTIESE